MRVGRREFVWRPVDFDDYRINYNALLGELTTNSVAYAAAYIESDLDQTGLLMKIGSDDQARAYLNGKEVYRHRHPRPLLADLDVVEGIDLNAGWNVLLFKVVNEGAGWEGSIRLTDAHGGPVPGIRIRLNPPLEAIPVRDPASL